MYGVIQKSKFVSLLFAVVAILTPLIVVHATYADTAGGNCSNLSQCDLINSYINPFVNFLSALVGVGVVTSIIIGGIQYSSSGGDPSKVTAAKNRIRNAIVALIAFLLLYGMLNFLIPGGLV
jgi:hypothetical protein